MRLGTTPTGQMTDVSPTKDDCPSTTHPIDSLMETLDCPWWRKDYYRSQLMSAYELGKQATKPQSSSERI